MIKLLILALTLLAIPHLIGCSDSADKRPTHDILGIQLGMTLREAEKELQKTGLSYHKRPLPHGAYGYDYILAEGPEFIDYIRIRIDYYTWVYYIGRNQKFKSGARPTTEKTKLAVEEKYGKNRHHRREHFQWDFDREGFLFNGSIDNNKNPCMGVSRSYKSQYDGDLPSFLDGSRGYKKHSGGDFSLPSLLTETCGKQTIIKYNEDFLNGFVNSITIELVDIAFMFDEQQARYETARKERQRKREEERNNGIVPIL